MLHLFEVHGDFTGDQPVRSTFGSLFHGLLMEQLPEEMSRALHESQTRPFSQHVIPAAQRGFEWRIGIWSDALADAVIPIVKPGSEFLLHQKGEHITIRRISHACLSESEWLLPFMSDVQVDRLYTIEYRTPATHKVGGEYAPFPSPALILNSLCRRFSEASEELHFLDDESINSLIGHTRISRYALSTAPYYLEGVKLQGYVGWLTLYLAGPDSLARLAGALLSFAEYAGIGIKTALGMGGCQVRAVKRREAANSDKQAKEVSE